MSLRSQAFILLYFIFLRPVHLFFYIKGSSELQDTWKIIELIFGECLFYKLY